MGDLCPTVPRKQNKIQNKQQKRERTKSNFFCFCLFFFFFRLILMTMYCAGLHSQRVLLLLLLLLSLMNTHILCIPVWAQGLVPGHSDSTAGGAPAVEDYDYESNYDYDGNPKTGASANSTRYAPFGFGTKSYLQPFFTIFSYYPVFNYHHYRYSVVFFLYLSLYQYKPIL